MAVIKKGQTRLTEFDEQILALYARGMTTRDIAEAFREMYGAEVSHTLVSKVTEAVIDQVVAWQNRPLESMLKAIRNSLECGWRKRNVPNSGCLYPDPPSKKIRFETPVNANKQTNQM